MGVLDALLDVKGANARIDELIAASIVSSLTGLILWRALIRVTDQGDEFLFIVPAVTDGSH